MSLQLKQSERSDYALISDKVSAAMETGNAAQARLVLKENEESFPTEVARIRREVQADYGTRL